MRRWSLRLPDSPATFRLKCKATEFGDILRFNSLTHNIHDVSADSSYDAAHRYLTQCARESGLRISHSDDIDNVREVITSGQILHVHGARLKKWIENGRQEWKGPRGMLFSQRPMIGD